MILTAFISSSEESRHVLPQSSANFFGQSFSLELKELKIFWNKKSVFN